MRKTKLITVQFDDGEQTLPSSIKIKCTVTGKLKGFYTPYLIKLIKRKYNNNYNEFINTYVSKGNKMKTSTVIEEDPYRLYREVLQREYNFLRNQPKSASIKHKIQVVKDRFSTRFPDADIEALVYE